MKFGIEKILSEWRKEAGLNKIRNGKYGCRIMYRVKKDYENHIITLTIMTDHPGYMIGGRGTLVRKYEKAISDDQSYDNVIWKVETKFQEVDGTL